MNYIYLHVRAAPKWYRPFSVLLKNSFKCVLNDDKVGDIFIKSGRSLQSLGVDGKKLSFKKHV